MNKLPRLDKKILSVGTLDDIDDEKAFWLSKNVQERLAAIELNRRMVYGKDRVTSKKRGQKGVKSAFMPL